jgi:hypothetical protein
MVCGIFIRDVGVVVALHANIYNNQEYTTTRNIQQPATTVDIEA